METPEDRYGQGALVMSAVCNNSVSDETFQEIFKKLEHFADTQFTG